MDGEANGLSEPGKPRFQTMINHFGTKMKKSGYNLPMAKLRILPVILLTLWIAFVFAAFYIVQKPLALQLIPGLLSLLLTLVVTGALLIEAAGLGVATLRRFFPLLDPGEQALLGTGLGLGFFGLLGFGLAASGLARPVVLIPLLVGLGILAGWKGWLRQAKGDFSSLWQALSSPVEAGTKWIPWLAGAALLLSFLLAFAPPADSFDALFYHLTVPAAWLRDGGLAAPQIIPHYWFPELVEGVFVWGLALGSETTAPLLHLAWGVLTVGLVWTWARKALGKSIAWRSIAVLISMPSLPLLASWAYTDLALAFYCTAVLYLLWLASDSSGQRIWILSGIFCGLAMGIKYTSFVLPLVALGWLAWTRRRHLLEAFAPAVRFALPAGLVAGPWYLRNWIWVGNPFYPFLFGGKYWDAFLSTHYSQAGTGIGFNFRELVLLPLNLTLGQRDANYFDGRIGPLWLILLPVCLWVLWTYRKSAERRALHIPILFGVVSLGVWTFGVINSSALWQSRLLFPALLPLAPLAALAWESLKQLDLKRFRFSFIFNTLAVISIAVSLLDFGLFVLARNPLAAALGMTGRQAYFERFQPAYADALELVSQTPPGSKVYFLYEPRSYGMSRPVTPDPINQNLAHDFYLDQTPEAIVKAWQAQGYAYVLYQRAGDSLLEEPEDSQRLFSLLEVVQQTSNTILYRLPPP